MSARRYALGEYERKRDFTRTPEPLGGGEASPSGSSFVVQKHAASRLHYDLRLELDGALKSWAVPKGPSLDPGVRALAVQVEDHPLDYASFEGVIPEEEYGGGSVMVWDRGRWVAEGDPRKGYEKGRLKFRLEGEKLQGRWILFRMGGKAGAGGKNWLLQKLDDDEARNEDDFRVVDRLPLSALSERTMEEIRRDEKRTPSPAPSGGEDGGRELSPSGSLPTAPAHAPQRELPERVDPLLPTLVPDAPDGDEWLPELKFDGYRILSWVRGKEVRLRSRRGHDWTDRFPTVSRALAGLGVMNGLLDGEVVWLSPDGTTDFQALQNVMNRGESRRLVYYAFDLLHYEGRDLTDLPLSERKELLEKVLRAAPDGRVIRYSDHIVGRGRSVAAQACRRALEGVVAKRLDSPYRSGRQRSWVKVKCRNRQELVVGGWTEPKGSRSAFGALLLGWYDDEGRLVYGGRVGTGFSAQDLERLRARLDRIPVEASPFEAGPSGHPDRDVHWVEPELVVEVEFGGWTDEGILRHASFQGLREDKPAGEVTREMPEIGDGNGADGAGPVRSGPKRRSGARVAGVRLTNPGRVLFPEQGLTKLDLARYYEEVSEWVLPHLVDRPLTMVRCPRGHEEKCFYQKHLTEGIPEPVRGIEVQEEGATRRYVAIDDLEGLITLVQFGVLEFHPWGSRGDRLERPDRLIFDLDPGEGVAWNDLVDAARTLGERLSALGLRTFVRTTGGKGLHVVAPLVRRSSWEEVKGFAGDVARELVAKDRERFIATSSKAKRRGKIFVDYLRNGRGATAVASYSTRARTGAPVAAPLRWEELTGVDRPDRYTVSNLPARLRSLSGDPWKGFFEVRQSITNRMKEAVSSGP